MGYTTEFQGSFALDKPLTKPHQDYLCEFSDTRRVTRDASKTANRKDPMRIAAGLRVGQQGAYFVGESGFSGQDHAKDIVDYNNPPAGQPGLWCQWIPSDDGCRIKWDGNEKFYAYTEWIVYLIDNFLEPWGYTLNGEVQWEGEDHGDLGKIFIENNIVSAKEGRVTYD